MSVDQRDVVDFIGRDRDSDAVVLSISDHREWGSSYDEHVDALRRKLESYVAFVSSGQLLATYPAAAGRPVHVEIIQKYEPDERGQAWLNSAKEEAARQNIVLFWAAISQSSTEYEPR